MILKRITIQNLGAVDAFEYDFENDLNVVRSRYTDEIQWQLITFLELLLITLDLHTDLEYNNVAKIYGFRMALNRFDTQHGGKKTRCQTKQKTK